MPIEVSLLAAAVVAALVIGVDEEPREAASAEAVVDMTVSRMDATIRVVRECWCPRQRTAQHNRLEI